MMDNKFIYRDKSYLLPEIINLAHVSVWASKGEDDDFKIVYWNQGAEEIYKIDAEHAIGKNYLDLFVSDLEREQSIKDCKEILSGKVIRNYIAEDITKNGESRRILANVFRTWDPREKCYLQVEIGINFEETERDKAELNLYKIREESIPEKFLDTINGVVSSLTRINLNSSKIDPILNSITNSLKENLSGNVTCQFIFLGKKPEYNEFSYSAEELAEIIDFCKISDQPIFINSFSDIEEVSTNLSFSKPIAIIQISKFSNDDIYLLVENKSSTFRPFDNVRKKLAINAAQLATLVFITKKYIDELNSQKKRIIEEESLFTRIDLMKDFNHKINNMLAPSILRIQKIKEGISDQEPLMDDLVKLESYINLILNESKKLEEVSINEEINITELLNELCRRYFIYHSDQIDFETKIDPSSFIITGDRISLINSFENIINNSIEALQEEKVKKIWIESKISTQHEHNKIRIRFTDTGKFNQKAKDTIFDLGNSTKGPKRGYGLFRSKQIIENHNGEIFLDDSGRDQLTSFVIEITQ